MATERKKPLTQEERADAARLREVVAEAKARDRSITQQKLAEALDVSQGAISHFINGRTALTTDRVLQFAAQLRVDPARISPRLARPVYAAVLSNAKHVEAPVQAYADLTDDERHLIDYIRRQPPGTARTVLYLARVMIERAVPDEQMENKGWSTKPQGAPRRRS